MPEPNGDVAAMIDAEVNEGGPPLPTPDTVIHLLPKAAGSGVRSATLLRSRGLELLQIVIPAGKGIPSHRASGEVTVQCLDGRVAFGHNGREVALLPGDLVHLGPQEPHSLVAISDAAVLITRLRS